jgi:glycosyltransferase involved in cell wall biosynthesis
MPNISNQLRLSVIINNYNYGQYLRECIDSVLAQGRPADEIIFVDDGSTDNSLEVIQPYKDCVKIISQENGGQLSAIITGAEEATGDILLFLDSDDTWKSKHLEVVEATYNSTPELGCLFTSLELFGANRGPHLSNKRNHPSKIIESRLITQYLNQFLGRPTSASAFRSAPIKQVLAACKELESDFNACADKVLSQGASLIGMSKLFIDECTVHYRTHESNAFYHSNRESDELRQERHRRNDLIRQKLQLAFPFETNANAVVRELKKNEDPRLLSIFYKHISKRMQLSKTSRRLLKLRLIIANKRLNH